MCGTLYYGLAETWVYAVLRGMIMIRILVCRLPKELWGVCQGAEIQVDAVFRRIELLVHRFDVRIVDIRVAIVDYRIKWWIGVV